MVQLIRQGCSFPLKGDQGLGLGMLAGQLLENLGECSGIASWKPLAILTITDRICHSTDGTRHHPKAR